MSGRTSYFLECSKKVLLHPSSRTLAEPVRPWAALAPPFQVKPQGCTPSDGENRTWTVAFREANLHIFRLRGTAQMDQRHHQSMMARRAVRHKKLTPLLCFEVQTRALPQRDGNCQNNLTYIREGVERLCGTIHQCFCASIALHS